MKNIEEIVKIARNKSDVARALNIPINGSGMRKVDMLITNIDTSHFDTYSKQKFRKYELIEKICPVCGNEFKTQKGHKKEKVTCSHSCSNTFHRSGINNPNYVDGERAYRQICFSYHKKSCIICGEEKIIEVHHYDENRENNKPENLVPLCPTHHKYWHSVYRLEIKDKVDQYVLNFKK